MMRLVELALRLGAEYLPSGTEAEIAGVASVERAGPWDLVFAEEPAALTVAMASAAGAVCIAPLLREAAGAGGKALLIAAQPRLAFAQAARLLRSQPVDSAGEPKIHATAILGKGTRVGAGVSIGAYTVLGEGVYAGAGTVIDSGVIIGDGVVLGSGCHIYPRVVVYPGTTLGDRVVVHAGAVLGADGFGYVRDRNTGAYTQFPQQGTLVLEDDVEIGANTTIDRGALEETRIARGAKFDNLIHIGHNVRIGRDVVIAAQTGISGSSTVGDGAIFGGQVGIGDHAEVGAGVILGGQGGILPKKKLRGPGVVFWGTPAKPLKEYLRELAVLAQSARSRKSKTG